MIQNSSTFIQSVDYNYLFKLLLIGDIGDGKTNLLYRLAHNKFLCDSHRTIGTEFAVRNINVDNNRLKVHLWGVRYIFTNPYDRYTIGVILVYGISNISTYDNLDKWLTYLKKKVRGDVYIMLVGNKSDLSDVRTVTKEEAAAYARQHSMLFLEVSAKTSDNVEEAFVNLIA